MRAGILEAVWINRSWLSSFSALCLPGPTTHVVFRFNVADPPHVPVPSGRSLEAWIFVWSKEWTGECPGWPWSQPLWPACAISGCSGRVGAESGGLAHSKLLLYFRCFRCEMFQWTKVLIPCLHACFYGISINVALTKNKTSLPEALKSCIWSIFFFF